MTIMQPLEAEQIKMNLVRLSPSMSHIVLRPRFQIDTNESSICPWMATDGLKIFINGEKMLEKDSSFHCLAYVHEIAHIIAGHCYMLRQEWYKTLNIKVMDFACENVANYIAKMFGFKIPPYLVYEEKWDGMTEWEIYHKIMNDPAEKERVEKMMAQAGSGDQGLPEHGKWGTLSEAEASKAKADSAAAVARVASDMRQKGQGSQAAFFARMVEALTDNTDWEFYLEKYLEHTPTMDWSYSRLDQRSYISGGMLYPGLRDIDHHRTTLRKCVTFIDTSGSVGGPMLAKAVGGCKAILEKLGGYDSYIGYCDAEVHTVGPLSEWKDIPPTGGGGTSFVPVFDWIKETLDDDVNVLIYFTDGMGSFPDHQPPYDVIWMDFGPGVDFPFGEVVKFKLT
ncbi:hypothetical protein D3C78_18880 [compost metagenome]